MQTEKTNKSLKTFFLKEKIIFRLLKISSLLMKTCGCFTLTGYDKINKNPSNSSYPKKAKIYQLSVSFNKFFVIRRVIT